MTEPYSTWEEALLAHQLPPTEFRQTIDRIPGLSRDSPAVLAGSIADGLANGVSDIDVYVVVDDEGVDPGAPPTQIVAELATRPVDIKLVRRSALDSLLEKLREFDRGGCLDARLAESFADGDRILLHRLSTGLAIQGHSSLAAIRAQIGDILLRHKYLCALNMVKRRQVSAQALFEEADWPSLLFIARDVVDASADILLAAAGDSSFSLKWRIKRLERRFGDLRGAAGFATAGGDRAFALPGPFGASPAATYVELSTFPAEPDLDSSFRYASAAIAWSRCSALFAGRALAGESAALETVAFPDAFRVPALALDAHLAFAGGGFALRRLGGTEPAWEISAEAAAILCMFDGSGQRTRPADGACHEVGRDLLESLAAFLHQRNFLIAPPGPEGRV